MEPPPAALDGREILGPRWRKAGDRAGALAAGCATSACPAPNIRTMLRLPVWFWLAMLIQVGANLAAVWTAHATAELMRGTSAFAMQVRVADEPLLQTLRWLAFPTCFAIMVWYLRPVLAWVRSGLPSADAPLLVRQRLVSSGVVLPLVSWASWVVSVVLFPLHTIWTFGHWSPDLVSQQVFSPLVSGTLAAVATYLLNDLVFRRYLVPDHFPDGRISDVPGTITLGVRGRLLIFVVAVGFLPLFTMLGLMQATAARLRAGYPIETVLAALTTVSWDMFVLYVAFGLMMTLFFARSLTGPLVAMAAALRRERVGNLREGVAVSSADEVGVLEDGVNQLLRTLDERERILATFGRVVEPTVRDRLLAGGVQAGGDQRTATVLFCDLRGFTESAEDRPPGEVVTTLNEFFTVMTDWVRTCGGFVDKFMGDAMLVVFGLFAAADDDGAAGAAAALRCAIGCRERLTLLNVGRAARGLPPLAMGLGVHTGEVVAGTIGAVDRHEFTVIGDAVNVASRLQVQCRDLETDLLISAVTCALAETAGMTADMHPVESVALRGRREAVSVVRLR